MKKLVLMMFLAGAQPAISQAQLTAPSSIIKTKPVKVTEQILLQENRAKVIPKLPDLRITSINVKHISNPGAAKYLEINFTVKNDGTAPVELSKVFMEGRIKIAATDLRFDSGCGTTLSTLGGLLHTGEVYSSSYRCYQALDYSVFKYYTLSAVIRDHAIKELDITNNSATTTILIQ